MGALGYDRFTLTAKAAKDRVIISDSGGGSRVIHTETARRFALALREAADAADSAAWDPGPASVAKAKGNHERQSNPI